MALTASKVFEAQNGFRVLDNGTEGPIYTGGPVSPVGLDFPVGTFYVQNNGTGAVVWRKYNTGVNDWVKAQPNDFYQTAISAAESSTTSTTVWTTKVSLTTPALPLGDYRLGWRYKWRAGANRQLDFRIRNGSDLFTSQPFTPSAAERRADAGFLSVTGISGAQTYNLDFKITGSGTTLYMSDAYLEFWRVA
jgi:hypothetical protein